MNQNVKIRNCDYATFLSFIPDKTIDFICIDPPYGKINGMQLQGQKNAVDGDHKINGSHLFDQLNRVIKDGGTICVFGQNPTYMEMVHANLKDYKYDLIGYKTNAAQGFHADKMPLMYTEYIAVFIHNENNLNKRTFNQIINETKIIDKEKYFCRGYAQAMLDYIGKSRSKIHKELQHRKLEFGFYYTGSHFGLLSEELYQELIRRYQIDQGSDFIPFDELKSKGLKEKPNHKNFKGNGIRLNTKIHNVLEIPKEKQYFHPTQKPVALMEKLILMYSHPGDVVLDCFAGSGSTGVAAVKNHRRFMGCEPEATYFDIMKKRILS